MNFEFRHWPLYRRAAHKVTTPFAVAILVAASLSACVNLPGNAGTRNDATRADTREIAVARTHST